jgi:hypothetical protein
LIWTVDPLTFCLATLILVVALLAMDGWSRSMRAAIMIGALVGYGLIRVLLGDGLGDFGKASSSIAGWGFSGVTMLAGIIAVGGALAAERKSGYLASLLVLVGLAAAFAGFQRCPVGWLGLLHQVAVLDITAICLATTFLGTFASPPATKLAEDQESEKRLEWIAMPSRIVRRTAIMLVIVCVTLAFAFWRDRNVFGLSELVGFWAGGSEVLAVVVAFQVIARWVNPTVELEKVQRNGNDNKNHALRLKMGLMVAGLAASLGLLLIPVIVVAARGLY